MEWPIAIHRPSLIVQQAPHAGTARLEFVENLRQYLSFLRAVLAAPALTDKRVTVSGAFDAVPLGDVAREMADSLRSPTDIRRERAVESVRFFHHIGGVELPLDDIRALVAEKEHGDDDIREIGAEEWARKAGELGMHPIMVVLFESLVATEGRLVFPRLAK